MNYGSDFHQGDYMKKLTILIVMILSCCALLPIFTACKPKDNKIRVSEVTHSLFYAPLYVAENMGYFKDEGLDIEITNAGGSDTVMSSLISNSAEIGLMGPESCVYVRNNGMTNAPMIFAQLTACDGSFLVGRTDGEFNWTDLKGKHVIAGRKGGMPAMTLQYILENKGLTTGSEIDETHEVKLDTTIAFNLTTSSFLAGTGDYVTIFDPTASQVEMDKQGYIKAALGDEVKDVPYTCFVATNSYLKNNGDKIEKFMIALKKGYDYLIKATDTEIITALKNSFSTTSDELILASVKNYIRIGAYASSFVLKESSWNTMLDIIDNAGELSSQVAWNSAVDTSFASKVEA